MQLILVFSILLRVAGVVYSIVLWRRLRDWRIGTLTAILALLSGRQIATLINEMGHDHESIWGHASEVPALFISFFTLLALFLFGRMLIEKQQAVDALKISEHKFSKAFRYTPDSITIFRLDDGTVVDVNEGFEQITGYSRKKKPLAAPLQTLDSGPTGLTGAVSWKPFSVTAGFTISNRRCVHAPARRLIFRRHRRVST